MNGYRLTAVLWLAEMNTFSDTLPFEKLNLSCDEQPDTREIPAEKVKKKEKERSLFIFYAILQKADDTRTNCDHRTDIL